MILEKNTLYVVATPIGNLGDMSQRALEVLKNVDLIAAEDTRHSGKLLQYFGIDTPCTAFHEHNERQAAAGLLDRVAGGETVALISDAGTPLMSDPGYHLLQLAHQRGIRVSPVPGASAVISALSVAGLPTDCFKFIGFLPAKSSARCHRLEKLVSESCTLVFFESPHRIHEMLDDLGRILGNGRRATLARELTKTFETIRNDSLAGLLEWVKSDEDQRRGEIVLVVAGADPVEAQLDEEAERILKILMKDLPMKQASQLAAEITGLKKKTLYQYGLELKDRADNEGAG